MEISFEKDDDRNHHVEFVMATSNLRAENYNIEPSDWIKVLKTHERNIIKIVNAARILF